MSIEYTVLMSVYFKEKPQFLKQSIESIINQTVKPSKILIIKDGLLTNELENILKIFQSKHQHLFNIIQLDKNVGLGKALNVGIKNCDTELIARMDSDDIAHPTRCEKQINQFLINPILDIVGSNIVEFTNNINNLLNKRIVPETDQEIKKFVKRRSPFNHPSVMYRKSAVVKAGGYQHFEFFEDYFLWIRMIRSGCITYNIQEFLIYMRSGQDLYKRRGGLPYIKKCFAFRTYMYKNKYCSIWDYIYTLTSQIIICLVPTKIRGLIYRKFLRESS